MKRLNEILILIMFVLLFLISYRLDESVSEFFKGANFPFFNVILSIITNFGFVILVILIIPSIMLYKQNKNLVYLLLLTFAVSFILAFVIKLIVTRQRPIDAFTYPFTSIINYSFPSMHAMVAFSLLPTLTKYLKRQKYFWIVFAFLVVFSRIYFGLHFLSDVVFGVFVGYFIGNYLLELYEQKKLWL